MEQVIIGGSNQVFPPIPAGPAVQSVAGGADVTLPTNVGASDIIELTGLLTGNIVVTIPLPLSPQVVGTSGPFSLVTSWIKLVRNNTTGPFSVTVKGPGGVGVLVAQGSSNVLFSEDGSNVFSSGGSVPVPVPTGTGLPHITAGVQDAAAIHGTVAGQILAVNAGVTDVAFVGVSQDATLSSTGALAVVQLTGAAGSLPVVATTISWASGQPTFSFAGTSRARIESAHGHGLFGGIGAGDYTIHVGPLTGSEASYGAIWILPPATARTGNNNIVYSNGSDVRVNTPTSGSPIYFVDNGSTFLANMSLSGFQVAQPIFGLSTAWGSVNGVGTQAMADANQTPAATVYTKTGIATTGALTANRNITLPTPTDAQGYAKWINNQCTGTFSVVVVSGGPGAFPVANGKSAWAWIDSRGATRMTADV